MSTNRILVQPVLCEHAAQTAAKERSSATKASLWLSPAGPGGGRGAGQPERFVCVGPGVGTESGDGHGGSFQWLERSSSQPCTLARACRSPNAGVADSERAARHHSRDFETPERHRLGSVARDQILSKSLLEGLGAIAYRADWTRTPLGLRLAGPEACRSASGPGAGLVVKACQWAREGPKRVRQTLLRLGAGPRETPQ